MGKQNIKNITCEIRELNGYYEFNTFEKVKKCLVCNNVYTHLKREYCLHCQKKDNLKIKLHEEIKERIGRISKDLTKFSCCCLWFSWFGQSIFWKTVHKDTICKHALVAMREINKNGKKT